MARSPKKTKPTRRELSKAVQSMAGKAMELGWSPRQTEEESREAMDKPKFVYMRVSKFWGPWKRDKLGNDGGFTLSWGAEKVGYGELTMYLKKGKLYADTEGMGASFSRMVLLNLFRNGITFDPKRK